MQSSFIHRVILRVCLVVSMAARVAWLQYLKRRCISGEECKNMSMYYNNLLHFKLLEAGEGSDYRSCEASCPPKYQVAKEEPHRCERCVGPCPKGACVYSYCLCLVSIN